MFREWHRSASKRGAERRVLGVRTLNAFRYHVSRTQESLAPTYLARAGKTGDERTLSAFFDR
jgi:hypothetical protein